MKLFLQILAVVIVDLLLAAAVYGDALRALG